MAILAYLAFALKWDMGAVLERPTRDRYLVIDAVIFVLLSLQVRRSPHADCTDHCMLMARTIAC